MSANSSKYDAVIVGAGFAGMYMLIRLRELGMTARVFEAGEDVGGTWYWNRYPGARCDIESMQYSYSFSDELQQEWQWSERYAAQPEILEYARHVVDRFNLRPDISFNCQVKSAKFSESQGNWRIEVKTSNTEIQTVEATFCIMATGCLSSPNIPKFDGLDEFKGAVYHTGYWPHHDVDFTDQNVAVIGTGSSGIQSIPVIAKQARHLTVFQRTPNYIVPAHNRPLPRDEQDKIKQNYSALREQALKTRNGIAYEVQEHSAMELSEEEREHHYQKCWQAGGLPFAGAFPDLLLNADSNATAAEFVSRRIKNIVKNTKTADLLTPNYTFACKRLCVDTDYYPTFNRENVTLVDVSDGGIERITESGPVANGKTYAVDAIVLATGFDAMTGALNKIDIKGREQVALKEKWQAGPVTYLGLMVSGFPNLFTITGPGSPSVLSNVLGSIEFHVDWISQCLQFLRNNKCNFIEATQKAEQDWVDEVNQVVDKTLYRTCRSWYLGHNIPGKPSVFMPYPGAPSYRERCEEIVANGYEGFTIS